MNAVLLISMVEKNPCLYNKSKMEFRDSDFKDIIWENIAAAVKHPVSDCRRAWKNIRDRYSRERRIQINSPDKPEWDLAKHLKFLDLHIQPRNRFKFLTKLAQYNADTEWSANRIECEVDNSNNSKDEEDQQDHDEINNPFQELDKLDQGIIETPPSKKKVKLEIEEEEDVSEICKVINKERRVESTDVTFGKLVTAFLTDIKSKKKKAKIMTKIMSLLEDVQTDEDS